MTFHSKSIVSFGQLLNNLTKSLTDGSPVPAALDVVKEHFTAQVVLLEISDRGRESVFVADSRHGPLGGEASSHDRSSALNELKEHYQHIAANEHGALVSADYAMWIFRDRDAPRFDAEEIALAGIVLAQIARALDLASRIDNSAVEKALYSSVLERLHVGVIIADNNGGIVNVSAVAENLLRGRDGLQEQAGKLRATNASEDRELHAVIRSVSGDMRVAEEDISRGLSLTKRSGARSLGIVVRRVSNVSPSTPDSLVAIYVRDSESAPEVESEFVRQIFDLTPAEAAVTHRLAAGLSLEDTAAALAISRNTARAHLRSIFSKSGITRQTELVRLVLNSAVLLGGQSSQAA
jgi:DNA-binding CsgD family transcriptional regulator